jgi:hypothetical protein
MHKLGLVSTLMIVGCGGGGGSSAPVDPASLDACLAWTNGVCRMAYLCVDTAAQDAAFQALYGNGSDTCYDVLPKRCESNQPAGNTFGPSCGPGKIVNQAALATCTANLDSMSCTEWTTAPTGGCENICGGTSSSPDAGAKLDAGSIPDAGTSGNGSVATQTDFCSASGSLACDRGFECDPAGSAGTFGSVAGCKGLIAYACASGGSTYCPNGYTPSLAPTCLADMGSAPCSLVTGGGSVFDSVPSCGSACKQ